MASINAANQREIKAAPNTPATKQMMGLPGLGLGRALAARGRAIPQVTGPTAQPIP
jgi:hypothetical protein